MICKNCNAEIDNSSVFCINCGTPVETEPVQQQTYQQPAYQYQPEQPVYQQQTYQQPAYQQPVYQQPVYQQPVAPAQPETAPVTKIGSYIGWFLVPCIPLIGFIMMIVFAVDGTNKNRANYFRAQFALVGILIGIALVLSIIALVISLIFGVELAYMF